MAFSSRIVLPLARAALVIGAVAAASPVLAQAPAAARQMRGPEAISDVLDEVLDTVVLISTSQNVGDSVAAPGEKDQSQRPQGEAVPSQPERPLDEFFKDFFERQQRGENRSRPTGEGSGFVIDAQGVIVTNFHVIDGADRIEVAFNDGTKLPAEVVGRDKDVDLAVLRVKPPKPLKAARFGDSERLRIGEWVLAVGNPFGIGLSATSGIVSGRNRDIRTGRYDNFIQTDASINKGNSGGPLFNLSGEVVGINTAILSPTGGSVGIGFAVPTSTVRPLIDQLIRFGEARRGYLGVRIQDVPPEVATRIGLATPTGALIAGVIDEGPAARAGIRVGDVVLSFDGKPVPNSRAIQRMVADAGVDREVEAVIRRDGKDITIRVPLGKLQPSAQQAEAEDKGAPKADRPLAPPLPTAQVLGLDVTPLDADSRRRFKIDPTLETGVVVVAVRPESPLKDDDVRVGDVITEVAQQRVRNPEELSARLAAVKKDGDTTALALVASADGKMRFVRFPVE